MKKSVLLILGALALAGCDGLFEQKSAQVDPNDCFSVIANNGNLPAADMLVDKCTGRTWLLVRSRIGDKAEDGFTYQWMIIERLDYRNPILVSGS